MGEVRWTEEAADWLREIHDHIALDHPEAALRTVRGIYGKVQSLSRFPRTRLQAYEQKRKAFANPPLRTFSHCLQRQYRS